MIIIVILLLFLVALMHHVPQLLKKNVAVFLI